MFQKTEKIVCVDGYRQDCGKEELSVLGYDKTKKWERLDNICCKSSLYTFIESLENKLYSLRQIRSKNEKEENEKKLFNSLLTNKDKKLEQEKICAKKSAFTKMSTNKSAYLNAILKKPCVAKNKQLINIYKEKHNTENKTDYVLNMHQKDKIKYQKEYVLSSNSRINKINRYYHDHDKTKKEENVGYKGVPDKDLFHGQTNTIDLYVNDKHIMRLKNIINIIDNSTLERPKIIVNRFIKINEIKNLLFSNIQNPNMQFTDIYRAESIGNEVKFATFNNEAVNAGYYLSSQPCNNETLVFILPDSFFQDLYGNFDFLVLKVHTDYLDKATVFNQLIETRTDVTALQWKIGELDFLINIASTIIYDVLDNINTNNGSFVIFSKGNDYFSNVLRKLLPIYNLEETTILYREIDFLFINSFYEQFIHAIPNLQQLLKYKTKFLVFDFLNNEESLFKSNLTEIYKSGGIISIAEMFFLNIDNIQDLNNLYTYLSIPGSKWNCKIPKTLYDKYLSLMTNNREKIYYNEMVKICKWLESCTEETEITSIDDYMKKLEKQYYKHKRFFYIINNTENSKYEKLPNYIFNSIKKYP